MTYPQDQNGPQKPWQDPNQSQHPQGDALDDSLAMPDHIAERLNQARREAVQSFERKQRTGRSKNWGATPWLAGAGLVAAAVSAVVIAPNLQQTAPEAGVMPIELIAAEEDLEFFETMEFLEWSLSDESTS
ncbi:MAG: hypothetical protein OXT49_02095 [Gammaproteobacteria bacterium]|nr:hypothetical protein [Gammaproteobacteria bacterium]